MKLKKNIHLNIRFLISLNKMKINLKISNILTLYLVLFDIFLFNLIIKLINVY